MTFCPLRIRSWLSSVLVVRYDDVLSWRVLFLFFLHLSLRV